MENNEKIIEIKNLCKYFKLKKRVFKAVDNLSFSIERGKICGFIGSNGAGKTTTIKMIVSATFPTSGEIFIGNQKVPSIKAKANVGYIPEKYVFYDDMLPEDYLVYLAQLSGVGKEEAKRRAVKLIKELGLEESMDKPVGSFSSGMKQKISLAQAIIHEPKVLILDEPTSNLDPVAKHQFLNIVKKLAVEKGVAVLISSHHLEELEKIIDKVVIINHGKLMLESDIKNLTKREAQLEIEVANPQRVVSLIQSVLKLNIAVQKNKVYLSVGNFNPVELKKYIFNLLMQNNEEIISINTKVKSLDDLFLDMLKNGK